MPFEPEKITKQNVLDAIEKIEKEKPSLYHSTGFDVIVNGKAYPPKEVMRFAHEVMNGERICRTTGGEPTNKYFSALGFEVKTKLKDDDSNSPETWNIWKLGCNWGKGKPSFYEFIKEQNIVISTKDLNYELGALVAITEGFPVKAIAHVIEKPLPVTSNPDFERAFAKYEIEYSERITFYEAEWYELKSDEIFDYELQTGISKIQKADVRKRIHDIWKNRNLNYWVFQCNPDMFDIESALRKNILSDWNVSAHKEEIKVGDRVIIWVTGKNAGCYALAEVKTGPQIVNDSSSEHLWKVEKSLPLKVQIEITHNAVDNPILRDQIKQSSELSDLKVGLQGTNFSATKEQYDTMVKLIEENSRDIGIAEGNLFMVLAAMGEEDAIHYFDTLGEIMDHLKLKEDDERLAFTVRSGKRLNFNIGNRYCLNYFPNSEASWGYIRSNKRNLPEDVMSMIEFKNPNNAYFCECSEFETVRKELDEIISAFVSELSRIKKSPLLNKDNGAFRRAVFDEAYRKQLFLKAFDEEYVTTTEEIPMSTYNLNTILYGPPGTGKTYHSIDLAVRIAAGKSSIHSENKKVFDELRKQGQIEFVTFHQNYSYEDFVVGLRPDTDYEQLRFKVHRGIFYEIARKAKENYLASKEKTSLSKSFDEAFSEIVRPVIEESKKVKVGMSSGLSYEITDVTEYSIHFNKPKGDSHHTLSIQTLRELVEGLREVKSGLAAYYYPLVDDIKDLMKPATGVRAEELKNFVLVIDEINRANISKVFGELITLIEDDKRLGEENELKITLPTGEKDFGVPPNLYIIATMNTADKSIALIDIALRRRFVFEGRYPKPEILDIEKAELLRMLNSAIYDKKKSADYLIGHAYFMKQESIESVLQHKVVPLLMEYFSGKSDIVKDLFNRSGWAVSYNTQDFHWDITKQ